MQRLKLDQEGARRGQLFAHSLQLGDDTVTIDNIATMAIESQQFQPFKTPANRARLGTYVGLFTTCMVIAVIALTWWGLSAGGLFRASGLIGWGTAIGFLVSGYFAIRLAVAMKKVEPYYRLRIGASDGRQIDMVDNRKDTLEQIRDAIRIKIDTSDFETVGSFDLDSDEVNLGQARNAGAY